MLKVYPAVALLVLLGVREKRARHQVWLVAAVAMCVALPDQVRDLARYGKIVPEVEGLMTFGARHLFVALDFPAGWIRPLSVGCAVAIFAAWWRRDVLGGWVPRDRVLWLGFVLGVALLAGCFFAGVSYAYRWVFALWLAPLLWQLSRDATAPRGARRLAVATSALLLWALWADASASSVIGKLTSGATPERVLQLADRFSYAEQPLLWALFICLLAFLAHFSREAWHAWRADAD